MKRKNLKAMKAKRYQRTGGGVAGITLWCNKGHHYYTVMKDFGSDNCSNHGGKYR